MQIVESKTGRYEVIWDDVADVAPERDMRAQRRSSSASQSLHAAASSTSKGLERVSSKLSEWSFDTNAPATHFNPRVVVFPDEDSRVSGIFQNSILGEDDILPIFTPPNSEATTVAASRASSHPASARISRLHSHESHEGDVDSDDTDGLIQKKTVTKRVAPGTIVYPENNAQLRPGARLASNKGKKRPGPVPELDRRLSNIEDSEVHFRNHRDSLTLARDRIVHGGGVSPEHIAHRDSVSMAMARKRAKGGKNHSSLSNTQSSYFPDTLHEDAHHLLPIIDVEMAKPKKADTAVRSLKNSASASMLRPDGDHHNKHIRIIE
jgi:hypothetical protein